MVTQPRRPRRDRGADPRVRHRRGADGDLVPRQPIADRPRADPGRGQRAESVPDAEGLEGGGVVAGEGGAAVAKVDAVDRGQGATTATVATGTRRVRGRPVLSAAAVA